MKKKNILSIGIVALLTSTFSANAADVVYEPAVAADPAPNAYNWTGFYAGAAIGWVGVQPNSAAAGFIQPDSSGFTGGVFVGLNYQIGSIVLGAEADINANAASASAPCGNPSYECNAGSDWNGSVRLRAGVALDRIHLYGTGGLAVANFNGYTDNGTRFADSQTLTGWTAGGGVEFAATQKLIIGVEALYADFGNATMQYDIPYNVSPNFTTVKLRAAWKF